MLKMAQMSEEVGLAEMQRYLSRVVPSNGGSCWDGAMLVTGDECEPPAFGQKVLRHLFPDSLRTSALNGI